MAKTSIPKPSALPPVPIMLDKPRTLRYKLTDAKFLDEELKCDGMKGEYFTGITFARLGILLWVGLRREDPSLTEESTCEIVPMESLREIVDAVMIAWGQDPEKARKAVEEAGEDATKSEAAKQPDPPPPTG